jgi:fused signal recognition particle receptor
MSGRMDRASSTFSSEMHGLVAAGRKVDDAFFDELLEVLVGADCGVELSERLVVALRDRVRRQRIGEAAGAIAALKAEILAVMETYDRSLHLADVPSVVLVVGVNGSGKTTTLGKLAYRLREEGRSALIAAADTYRAAAIDQMRVWADRAGTDVVAHQPGADPGAVVFDAIQAAQARRVDVVLVDTAGRLHTKVNLMAELGKIRRVIERLLPEAPQEVLLVVDATTGMNAMRQAFAFHEITTLTGLVITKLDGTARGGTLLAVEEQLKVPVKLVGLGEGLDDLNVFDPAAYLDTLFGATP